MTKAKTGKIAHLSGQVAEEHVARHYVRNGWRLLQQRYRNAAGEIDLILRRADTILCVEVKRARTHAAAAARISLHQITRIHQCAEIYVSVHFEGCNIDIRMDAALVDQNGVIEIIPNALAGF